MKTKLLKVIFLVVVACIVLSLFFVEIKPLLVRCNLLNILNQNLAFIAKQIEKFGSLIIISLLVFVIIYFKSKFTLEISSFSIGNININIKNIDRVVISNIRNYLNSKRTLFLIDIEYDNFYDVFDSYHQIYCFLREQIQLYDSKTDSKAYESIETAFKELNTFLTKHQTNYRRWYEAKSQAEEFAELDIHELQKKYRHYDELCADLTQINVNMNDLAKQFNINTEKWK